MGHIERFRRALPGAVLACLASGVLSPVVLAQNDAVSLDLNADALRLSWAHINPERQFRTDGSWLHHQDHGNVASVGFHITGNAATAERPINAGLGGRVLWASTEQQNTVDPMVLMMPVALTIAPIPDEDGAGLAVGGFFDAKIPNYDRIGFGGHLYFAPDILTFGDLEQYTDLWLYGSYSVLRQGDIYLGVRNVKGDFKRANDFNFDTGVHVGFTLKF